NPEADIGIHLTMTSEWDHYRWRPLTPADRVPSLVDKDGFFWKTTKELFEHAVLDEIEIEARAQIEVALRWGLNLLHIRRGQKDPRRGRCDAGELPDARRAVAKHCGVGGTAAPVLDQRRSVSCRFAAAYFRASSRLSDSYTAEPRSARSALSELVSCSTTSPSATSPRRYMRAKAGNWPSIVGVMTGHFFQELSHPGLPTAKVTRASIPCSDP